jgi:hypothetical protein
MPSASLVASLCDHLLPVDEVATEMIHHLCSAQAFEPVEISLNLLDLSVYRVAVCQACCEARRDELFASHLYLPLGDIVLHGASWPPYIVPGELL